MRMYGNLIAEVHMCISIHSASIDVLYSTSWNAKLFCNKILMKNDKFQAHVCSVLFIYRRTRKLSPNKKKFLPY